MKVLVAPLGNGIRKTGTTDSNMKYEVTKYRFQDNETDFETSLIFEAIIRYQLSIGKAIDEIILVGTVHSCWQDLYDYCIVRREKQKGISLSDEELDYFEQIEQESQQVGRNSSTEELEHFQKFLEPLEQMISENLLEDHLLNVHIQIMQYGIDESESFFNYQKLCSSIEQYTSVGEQIDILLDITHSFRSMPIYYFLVLNYLIRISKQDVKVSAVYYGMFELKNEENLDYTPVINMNYMISTMDWINSLNEVNSYGSVYGVTKCLGGENDISKWLQIFEWATNTNDYSLLTESIHAIVSSDISHNVHTAMEEDALKRIQKMLQDKFPMGSMRNVSMTQLKLAQWFFEQRRYGLAILTIQECVKTYMTYLMLKYWDKKRDSLTAEMLLEKLYEEGTRSNSLKVLKEIASEEPNARKLQNFYNKGKQMRNTMAHLLKNIDTGQKTGNMLLQSIEAQRKEVERYLIWMERCIRENLLKEEVERHAQRVEEEVEDSAAQGKGYDRVIYIGRVKRDWNWTNIYKSCKILKTQMRYIGGGSFEKDYQTEKSYKEECKKILNQVDNDTKECEKENVMVLIGNTNMEKGIYLIKQLSKKGYTVKLLGESSDPCGNISLVKKNIPF